ncbi:MAG: hypothetical protein IH956_08065, partial [Chloroflexi bacterium]|nr:hypothetical protein [Chloroflexota bacterium]
MAQALRGVSRDTTMVDDREEPEEKIEKFDEFGQALEGYISLEQARVLAIQHARDNRDFYGGRYRDRDLVWEVASADEGEDYYEIRLSYRPAGRFRGEPGLEQFTIDKTGSIELRQILDEPRARRSISMLVLAIVGVVVIAGAAGGVLFASGALGGGDGESAPEAPAPEVLASTPTVQPLAQAAVVGPTPTGGAPAAVPAAGECTTRAEAESLMDSVTPAIDAWKAQGSLPPRVGEILAQLGDPAVLIQQGEFQAACAMLKEMRAAF